MLTLPNAKGIATVLLMICFVLPLSRCTRDQKIVDSVAAATGVTAAASAASAPVSRPSDPRPAEPAYEDKFAYKNVSIDDPAASVTTLAAFFWPLVFVAFARRPARYRVAMAANVVELALCAGSTYIVYGITFFGDLRYGGYLAFLAIAVYGTATLAQMVLRWRARARSG